MTAIPRGRKQLTAGWLNEALAGECDLPRVRALQLDDSVEQGLLSDVVRVIPTYEHSPAAGIPEAFIVKLSSPVAAMREREATRLGYLREVSFYRELGERAGLPVAACYHAAIDVETGYHVLVLEDLAGMVRRSPEEGCSLAEAESVVRGLADMHARWWDTAALDGLGWLPERERLDPEASRDRHAIWWPRFVDQYGERLTDEMLRFGERLGEVFAPLMNDLTHRGPRTLRHGDYGLSNLMFDDPAAAGPGLPGFRVIDWQLIGRGKGAWDLAWFLGQSLTETQRWQWEAILLSAYHESLVAAGVADYPAEYCLADYQRALAQRFGTLISSLVALPFTPEQKADIRDVQLPRNLAAIAEHGGLALLDDLPGSA